MLFRRYRTARRIRRALEYPLIDCYQVFQKRKTADMALYLRARSEYYRLLSEPFYKKIAPDQLRWVRFHRKQHFQTGGTPPCCEKEPCFLIHSDPKPFLSEDDLARGYKVIGDDPPIFIACGRIKVGSTVISSNIDLPKPL